MTTKELQLLIERLLMEGTVGSRIDFNKRIGVSKDTVRNWVSKGSIPASKQTFIKEVFREEWLKMKLPKNAEVEEFDLAKEILLIKKQLQDNSDKLTAILALYKLRK